MSNEYEKVEFSDVTESEMQDNPEWILRKIDDFVASGNTNKDVVDIVGDFCSKSLELLFKFMSVYSDGEHFDICEEVIKKIHRYVDKFDQINRFNDVLLIYLKLIKVRLIVEVKPYFLRQNEIVDYFEKLNYKESD